MRIFKIKLYNYNKKNVLRRFENEREEERGKEDLRKMYFK